MRRTSSREERRDEVVEDDEADEVGFDGVEAAFDGGASVADRRAVLPRSGSTVRFNADCRAEKSSGVPLTVGCESRDDTVTAARRSAAWISAKAMSRVT